MRTARLLLRRWRPPDRDDFARLNADKRVMEFFPGTLSREESDNLAEGIEAHFEQHGFGPYAAELLDGQVFIGYIGLAVPRFQAHFTSPGRPCVEIGWRLAAQYWGRGLATEGARTVVEHAFGELGLSELVSFTVPGNLRSRRVMEKLGMTHDPAEDFDHPDLPKGHVMRRHVLYRLRKS